MLNTPGAPIIRVRQEQMESLAEAMLRNWITVHVQEIFPRQVTQLGRHNIENYVSMAIEESRKAGFSRPSDIASYVDLVFLFGHQFPLRCPWAREALSLASDPFDGGERMTRLYDAAVADLREQSALAAARASATPARRMAAAGV
jgi:hypothetical protein